MTYVNTHPTPIAADEVVIRLARSDDAPAIARLSALDSQRPLAGPTVVAEKGGRPRAALALLSGRIVADPFVATADLVALLELRAGALRGRASGRVRGSGMTLRRRRTAFARG